MFIPEKIFGILGCPLGHSLSPILHNWGFQSRGYPGAYFVFEKWAEELPGFMAAVRNLPVRGLSVTIPHKQAVIPFLDKISPEARQAGAVNTIYRQGGRLCGENTDISGFCAPLLEAVASEDSPAEQTDDPIGRALILGAGGAARAAVIGLRKLGCENIFISARRSEPAEQLAAEFRIQAVPWEERGRFRVDLLINSTPLGLKGEKAGLSPWPEDAFAMRDTIRDRGPDSGRKPPLAYDLIYTPAETLFLRQAKAHGWRTLNGFPMFVAQGLAQFELWTGLKLPAGEAAAILEQRLSALPARQGGQGGQG